MRVIDPLRNTTSQSTTQSSSPLSSVPPLRPISLPTPHYFSLPTMLFSLSTIAAVAALLSVPSGAEAAVLDTRGSSSLCNQKNYGASGYPWQVTSSPGSFCGSSKPSNNKQWQSLVSPSPCAGCWRREEALMCSRTGMAGTLLNAAASSRA